MGFLISPNGERLHKLCHYHNHKTALFYCVFLGPFRLRVGIDHMDMQMRVYSFWCLSLNLNSDTYPDKLLLQQAVLPEAVHLPSKHIQRDDHNSFSSGLVVFGVFFSVCCSTVAFPWGFGKGGTVKGRIRSVTENVILIPTSEGPQ